MDIDQWKREKSLSKSYVKYDEKAMLDINLCFNMKTYADSFR